MSIWESDPSGLTYSAWCTEAFSYITDTLLYWFVFIDEPVQGFLCNAESIWVEGIDHEGHCVAVSIQNLPVFATVARPRTIIDEDWAAVRWYISDFEASGRENFLLFVGHGTQEGGFASSLESKHEEWEINFHYSLWLISFWIYNEDSIFQTHLSYLAPLRCNAICKKILSFLHSINYFAWESNHKIAFLPCQEFFLFFLLYGKIREEIKSFFLAFLAANRNYHKDLAQLQSSLRY